MIQHINIQQSRHLSTWPWH